MKNHYSNLGSWSGLLVGIGWILSAFAGTYTVTNTRDSDSGSLFWAINQANMHKGADTIRFAIPTSDPNFNGTVWTIKSKISLPGINDDGTVILGSSQTEAVGNKNPSGPEITLDGTDMPQQSGCFCINSAGNVISGFAIFRFRSAGVTITGDGARNNRIVGNTFGTNPAGTDTVATSYGVSLELGAKGNWIGGSEPNQGNLISGCQHAGIYILKSDSNIITGNIIGLDRTGKKSLGNYYAGILIGNARGNRVGGSLPGERNIISGNVNGGIVIDNGKNTRYNTVQGNYIGTDINGKAAVGNGLFGVSIGNGASVNFIGGTKPEESNLISGNSTGGIIIYSSQTDSNRIIGNRIGTDAAGLAALPNKGAGITVYYGPRYNNIGPSNVIRYNLDGIFMQDTTLYNRITQNSISNNTRRGIIFFNNPNGGILPPTLLWDKTGVKGKTVPKAVVEVFSDSSDQGRIYEGWATADGNGQFSWSGTPKGPFVTATATDPSGNTSVFSTPAPFTGVAEKDPSIPRVFSLYQNFPNPFNPATIIPFDVKEKCRIVLDVVDVLGRNVTTLVNEERQPGRYQAVFDARNLPSGIYFYKINMKDFISVKKMVALE